MSSEANSNSRQKPDNRWIPLESNPEVFNAWAKKAGLATKVTCFHDIYGVDPELLGLVPQPVNAVILLFPITPEIQAQHEAEDEALATEGQPEVDKTIMWMKQTIGNACGTMALLHALANTNVTITPESALAQFIEQCKDKTPLERAHLLETTSLFANIHAEMAGGGQSSIPTNLDTNLHFICYVAAPSRATTQTASSGANSTESGKQVDLSEATFGQRLVELDGRRRGPIDRGECRNLLCDAAEHVKSTYFSKSDAILFSLMALAPPQQD
ncbi:hypothetical protein APHAL10511_000413 [Amanita phalloides]|nr:hypothetical protein APHAL10511_000413 [Amanita phalloides]